MTLEEKAEEYKNKICNRKIELHECFSKKDCDEIKRAYLAGAEEVKADCDFALEGKDLEIKELKEKHESSISQWKYELNRSIHNEVELAKENNKLLDVINNQDVKIADLEKMLAEQYPDLKQSLDWANKREKELLEQIEKMKKCAICVDRHIWCVDCVNKSKFRLDVEIKDENYNKGVAE